MLSPIRLYKTLIDYKKNRVEARELPMRLWVESSSRCNLKCVMCPNKALPPEQKTVMEFDLFRKIVDEASEFVNDIYLHHRGEPLTNPRLDEMIAYAKKAGISARFHTNGCLMNSEWAQRLLEAGPDLISFSVDGFEKETYEQIRAGGNFETTVENITRLAQMRKNRGLSRPYLVVEKIRFKNPSSRENPDKVAELKKKFLEAGVDEVIEKDEYIWAEEDAPEPETPRQYAVCTFPWYGMVILANGTVTACPQDFAGKMKMGNVSEHSIKQIWNGPTYKELRGKFKSDLDSLPLCRKCDRLHRKTIGGVPFQYMFTFLIDHVVGYNKFRKIIGTSER